MAKDMTFEIVKLDTDRYCPVCGSREVEYGEVHFDRDMVHIDALCCKCGSRWSIGYEVKDAYILKDATKHPAQESTWGDCVLTIMGCDASFDESGELAWGEEHELVAEFRFDTTYDALDFLRDVTIEQVIAWEKEAKCNSLDVIVQRDVFKDGVYDHFDITAEAEWVGSSLNGIWCGNDRIA